MRIRIENLDRIVDEFKKAPKLVDRELQSTVKSAGKEILGVEKIEAPVATGNLRRSISMSYKPIMVKIAPKSNYAIYVHEGTGLFGDRHDYIRPKNAKVLAFRAGGKMVFTKRVAGQKANPFVDRTAKRVEPSLNKMFNDLLDNLIKKI